MTTAGSPLLRIVLCTCADREEATRIARSLVEGHLAACVNILPGVHSIYRWQEEVESADEVLLLIKTSSAQLERVREAVAALHSYAVPELLALDTSAGSEAYLQWLLGSLK